MGKIVKYCAECEESFAEKFAFCPNCGNAMKAFEMNPLKETVEAKSVSPVAANKAEEAAPIAADNKTVAQTSVPASREAASDVEPPISADTTAFSNGGKTESFSNDFDLQEDDVELEIFDKPKIEKPETAYLLEQQAVAEAKANDADQEIETLVGAKAVSNEVKTITPAKTVSNDTKTPVPPKAPVAKAAAVGANGNGNGNGNQYRTVNSQPPVKRTISPDDGFHVTVIQEKNVKQRNGLLLGAMVLMLTLVTSGMIYSIFNHPLLVGAIGEDLAISVPVVEEVPMEVEEEPKPKAEKESGGGGGGGREEETPTSKGRLATQTPDPPLITPTKTIPQKDNFELKMIATTQGTKTIKPTEEPYGDPNAKYLGALSDGRGKGGGQGSGEGTGQGSGRGTGQGSGLGSGSGGGVGGGNGDGSGDGNSTAGRTPPPPAPVKPVGVTQKIKFISKPKASYTDQARTNQIQGTVRLRVTFSATGQIGSISPVSGLPYGLTEQAIAAARQIRFEPAKRNGVPIPTTAVVEYNFNIY